MGRRTNNATPATETPTRRSHQRMVSGQILPANKLVNVRRRSSDIANRMMGWAANRDAVQYRVASGVPRRTCGSILFALPLVHRGFNRLLVGYPTLMCFLDGTAKDSIYRISLIVLLVL